MCLMPKHCSVSIPSRARERQTPLLFYAPLAHKHTHTTYAHIMYTCAHTHTHKHTHTHTHAHTNTSHISQAMFDKADELKLQMERASVRVTTDYRDNYTPG